MPIKPHPLREKVRIPNAIQEDEWPISGVGGESPQTLAAYSSFPYKKWQIVRKAEETPTFGRGFSVIHSASYHFSGIIIT